jgi:hypothetical protein
MSKAGLNARERIQRDRQIALVLIFVEQFDGEESFALFLVPRNQFHIALEAKDLGPSIYDLYR